MASEREKNEKKVQHDTPAAFLTEALKNPRRAAHSVVGRRTKGAVGDKRVLWIALTFSPEEKTKKTRKQNKDSTYHKIDTVSHIDADNGAVTTKTSSGV